MAKAIIVAIKVKYLITSHYKTSLRPSCITYLLFIVKLRNPIIFERYFYHGLFIENQLQFANIYLAKINPLKSYPFNPSKTYPSHES